MGYDSLRNKALVEFPNGKLMLFADVSDSRTFDCRGRRVWNKTLFHPKESLFYTKDGLKAKQTEYVEHQLEWLRDFEKRQVETGWAKEYIEPDVNSYDFAGTRWPSGCRIKDGRAFYGGRPIKAEEYFSKWDSPKRITFGLYKEDKYYPLESMDILNAGIDDYYKELKREYGGAVLSIR